MWYVIQTQTGKEQELTECIEHVLAGEGYRACFVIEQECIWRMGGERTIYRKPLFPSYVIADTDTPEAFFLALKRIPKLSKLLRTDCEFWSIREAEKELLCRMMGRTAADVDEDKIKDICREKAKISKKAASAGVNEMRESAQKKHYIVRLSPVTLDADGNIVKAEGPLAFFKDQGVDLKVISGDDPVTVSAIAKKAGLENADKYIDATTITTPEDMERAVAECSVFGRVTPQQKKEMVLALQKQKHTVAMTGDGVNDVLALKEADCSVVMAEGSDAAKNIANVVLMDSNFAAMPEIVNQGRRVVNNIRTAASMFLIKTIFSVLLCLITIFWGDSYPFEPIQMSLISACAVGIPTFLLAQENNFNKIESGFLRYVFMNAFPAAVTITGCVFTIMLVCQNVYHSNVMLSTACFLVTGWNYMAALKTVYAPLSRYRKIIIYGMQFIFFFAAVCVQNLLALGSLEFGMIILVFILMTFSPVVIEVITEWCRSLYNKAHEKEKKGIISLFLEKVQK